MLSRTFLASLNVFGCADLAAEAGGIEEVPMGVGVKGEGVKDPGSLSEEYVSFLNAKLLASSVSFGPGVTVVTPFGWMIVIGTLRLFGPGLD